MQKSTLDPILTPQNTPKCPEIDVFGRFKNPRKPGGQSRRSISEVFAPLNEKQPK
jgi:hypothetical protein